MKWYLAKTVHRIICGEGNHTPQFDEQLRLVSANDEDEAYAKAFRIGCQEEDTFFNQKQQLVQWKFVDIAELYCLTELIDGAELYSKINEVDDAAFYTDCILRKAASIRNKESYQILNLI
ncbi:MAG: DUF4288 domain-containing protein [Flavisolibacter sp.]